MRMEKLIAKFLTGKKHLKDVVPYILCAFTPGIEGTKRQLSTN